MMVLSRFNGCGCVCTQKPILMHILWMKQKPRKQKAQATGPSTNNWWRKNKRKKKQISIHLTSLIIANGSFVMVFAVVLFSFYYYHHHRSSDRAWMGHTHIGNNPFCLLQNSNGFSIFSARVYVVHCTYSHFESITLAKWKSKDEKKKLNLE